MSRTILLKCGLSTIVDDEDYDRVINYGKWHIMRTGGGEYANYVTSNGFQCHSPSVRLHRFILGLSNNDGKIVDHINRDGLDNRKENLRIVTFSLNGHNRKLQKNNKSGYRGVYWYKKCGKWRAKLKVNKELIECGCFQNIIDAAKAYDLMAFKYFGKDAILNIGEEVNLKD